MTAARQTSISYRILQIALPSIISNITVPLLGLVDVAIVGHLGSPAYIGAIAIGGMLFNIIYWIFGFLRMGTSGMTSQAYGQRNLHEVGYLFFRSIGVGLLIATGLLLLQYPIRLFTLTYIIHTTPEIAQLATRYFNICIWGAPATLGLYGLTGWFIGMQNSRFPMYIALAQNCVNILVSLSLVYLFNMTVEGVALGTLIAQYVGFFFGLGLWLRKYNRRQRFRLNREIINTQALYRFFNLNKDIFLRTLCLVSVTLFFTSAGAAQGEVILAVNTLLMQLFTLFSYIMDGFAYAAEALTGRYIGARNDRALHQMIRKLFLWGFYLSVAFTLAYAVGGTSFLKLLSDDMTVIHATKEYFYWATIIPLAGFAAFLWDGVFIGATATRPMLYSMFVASALFFGIYYGGCQRYANHALWLAFISYLFIRGVMQTFYSRKILPQKTNR
ncbi:MAG: MATE family efflux transporter [Bacteroidia bacterium]|nr:MATE family efflux transporter [Bacteroidia bacterium]